MKELVEELVDERSSELVNWSSNIILELVKLLRSAPSIIAVAMVMTTT